MVGVAYTPAPLTYDDYRLLPDDGKRYELMDGDLFVSPAPSTTHQLVLGELLVALRAQLAGTAVVLFAPVDVILSSTSVVQPDLVVVRVDRKHLITKRAIEGAPDLVVEVLSPGSIDRDQQLKRRLYERFGIPEYWIVDPDHGQIEIWRMHEGRYGVRAKLDRASTLTSPDFPAIAIPLLPVFAEI